MLNAAVAQAIVHIATAVWRPLGVLSVFPALFSVMLFDAPGSEHNLATIALASSLISFPYICWVSVSKSRAALNSEAFSIACLWSLLPLINLAIGSAGLAWISWFQGGKFTA